VLRLFIALQLLSLSLLACQGGYSSCIQKITDSQTIKNCSLEIPVTKQKRLIFSLSPPNAKIIKYDPFLQLYLVEDKNGFKYPFKLNRDKKAKIAAVDNKDAFEGKIVKHQVGLNKLAEFSESIFYPSILSSSCCNLEGVVTPKGIIEKEYIKRFLKSNTLEYGDIGIRVKDVNSFVEVVAVDPFFKGNPFKRGDCIVAINSQKFTNSSDVMRKILFSKVGATLRVKIKRSHKFVFVDVALVKRYGGGYVSDTFLEQKGIYFNTDLKVKSLEKTFKKYGLNIGDKLLSVNGIKVQTQQELLEYITRYKNFSTLLFLRDGFQFFVKIN